jgi:hypothetical protein
VEKQTRETQHVGGAAHRGRRGAGVAPSPPDAPKRDGISLKSVAHPPGLIDQMAEAIRSGKLSTKKSRAPAGSFDRKAYQREYMRNRRRAEKGAQ